MLSIRFFGRSHATKTAPTLSVIGAALLIMFAAILPLSAQTLKVSAGTDLSQILPSLKGGETVVLAPGKYPPIAISGLSFSKPVKIVSETDSDLAVLTGIRGRDVSNLIFERLHLKYEFDPSRTVREPRPFHFTSSSDITIRGSVVEGAIATKGDSVDRGFAVGKGLAFDGGQRITIEKNEIFQWFAGTAIHSVDSLKFINNNIHSIRSDGFNCSALRSGLIANNHFHDFKVSRKSPDHPDMIQCWTTHTTRRMEGLTIKGNIMNSGQGLWTQSIFIRNEGVDKGVLGRDFFYRNITIEDNIIINAHLNGVFVGHANGVVVKNNTIVRTRHGAGVRNNPKLYTPALQVHPQSSDVVISGNIVNRMMGYENQPSWKVTGNFLVQDDALLKPNHYSQVFAGFTQKAFARPEFFKLRSDGPLGGQQVGAPALRN